MDGVLGPGTLAVVNVPVEARIEQIRANLERARWVFYDPESEFLVVNIAGFRLYVIRRGEACGARACRSVAPIAARRSSRRR